MNFCLENILEEIYYVFIASDTINQEKQATISLTEIDAEKQSKKDKPKKIKMIRDSFTMPESDYIKLSELKKRCLNVGVHVKKSELVRAGLLNDSRLADTIC